MLGISIYPYKENELDTLNYIATASKYGFKRIFTNLLQLDESTQDEILRKMKNSIFHARKHNMEVILDINPKVFERLNIDYKDLSFFKDMGATGIRLDSTFDGLVESLMTFDNTNMDIEINISNYNFYLENILAFQPNKNKIIGCHNFYPQKYTGLDYDYFIQCSKKYKELGIRTAAFINSKNAQFGPHNHMNGLCTLEMHREMDIVLQAKHLIATNIIDDIIIANSFASEDELKQLSELSQNQIELSVVFSDNTTDIEKEIVLNNQHFNRGDINSYSIRSTFVRLEYKNNDIPKNNCKNSLCFGDITIGNNDFGQYKGELGIVKLEMDNSDNYKNVVANVLPEEHFLLSYIKPWTKFMFKENNIKI